jgi:hypothetical protein
LTLESSKIVKLALTWIATKQRDEIHKDHALYSDFFSSKRKCKPEGYHAVCVQYVAVSCCLSAKQMATSKQDKVPTKQGHRLDHATKLEASLARQFRCHVCVVKVCGLFMTLCVTCNFDADASVCKSKNTFKELIEDKS